VRKMKALTVKMETVTPTDKRTQNLICFVYEAYEIYNKIFFLSGLFLEDHLRYG
jgi:hypothetical protein